MAQARFALNSFLGLFLGPWTSSGTQKKTKGNSSLRTKQALKEIKNRLQIPYKDNKLRFPAHDIDSVLHELRGIIAQTTLPRIDYCGDVKTTWPPRQRLWFISTLLNHYHQQPLQESRINAKSIMQTIDKLARQSPCLLNADTHLYFKNILEPSFFENKM